MNADLLLRWLLDATIATTLAAAACLLLRAPLRRMSGARAAYGLWLAVPLATLVALLPRARVDAAPTGVTSPLVLSDAAWPLAASVLPVATAGPVIPWPLVLTAAWCIGAAGFAATLARRQQRYVRGLGDCISQTDGTFLAAHCESPVVLGAWRPRIVLPVDFATRYPGVQAELVRAHERAHVARGDVLANLAAATLRCVFWFNPLIHVALPRFLADQELACDATVLEAHPGARRSYADAMLNTQLAGAGLPVGCHWTSTSALKERIMMLKTPLPTGGRRRAGLACVLAVSVLVSAAAWAAFPAGETTAPREAGSLNTSSVLLARVEQREKARSSIEITAGFMAGAADGSDEVGLDARVPMRITAKTEDGRALRLEVVAEESVAGPAARWTLLAEGREIAQGRAAVGDTPVALPLQSDALVLAALPRIVLRRPSPDHVHGAPTQDLLPMRKDPDGIYRLSAASTVAGPGFKVEGTALVRVAVGRNGRVDDVVVESVTPAGAVDPALLEAMVRRDVFVPEQVDGRPVPTRIRVPIHFGPRSPVVADVIPVRFDAVPVREAALRVAAGAGYRLQGLDVLEESARITWTSAAVAPEIALQRIARAGRAGVGIEDGAAIFLPLAAATPAADSPAADPADRATSTTAPRELIEVSLRVDVGDGMQTPRLVVRDGEPFAIRTSSPDGRRSSALEMTARRESADTISIGGTLHRDGVLQDEPRIVVREGKPGRIVISRRDAAGADVPAIDLEVVAKGAPATPRG